MKDKGNLDRHCKDIKNNNNRNLQSSTIVKDAEEIPTVGIVAAKTNVLGSTSVNFANQGVMSKNAAISFGKDLSRVTGKDVAPTQALSFSPIAIRA